MADLEQSFNERAAVYDTWIERICPRYREALNVLIGLLPAPTRYALELGCGTGNLSVQLLERFPALHLTVIDVSPEMLKQTRAKLARYGDRVAYCAGTFEPLPSTEHVDVVISSLAIHHLTTAAKERLFGDINKRLYSGGYFYTMDQIEGAAPELVAQNHDVWVSFMRANGLPETEIADALRRRREQDKCDTLAAHLAMLKHTGFTAIDVVWKYYGLAVFGGRKW